MKRVFTALSIAILIFSSNARAGSVGGMGGALEITQLANNVQLVQSAIEQALQTQHQLNMYMSMIENMKSLTNVDFQNVQQVLLTLNGVINQAHSISYQMGASDEYFSRLNPDYAELMDGVSFATQQTAWWKSVYDMCKYNLKTADIALGSMQNDAQVLGALINASRSATGQKAVIQAGNEINTQMVHKLMELKILTAAQVQAQSAYMTAQKAQEEAETKNSQKAHEFNTGVDLTNNKPLIWKRID